MTSLESTVQFFTEPYLHLEIDLLAQCVKEFTDEGLSVSGSSSNLALLVVNN